MTIRIRSCVPADARLLSLLGQATMLATYAQTVPVDDIVQHCEGPHSIATYADFLSRADHRLWLAEFEATAAPVGYAVMAPTDLPIAPREGDVELKRLYVLQGHHGGGLGARMISTVADAARAEGFNRLLLSVFSLNAKAIGFYARQGFTQAGTHRFHVGSNDYDDLILAKSLQA